MKKIALFLLASGGLVFFGGARLNAAVVEPPGNLQRTSYVESPRSITLAWQDNSNNESGFLIEWSADGGTTWSEFGQAGADVTSFSGSLPGEQVMYLFRIQATDGTDVSGYSNVISVEGTDPNTADTDGDGIKDGYEASHGLNPYEDDSYEDLDGDRYPNIFEFVKGTDSNDALSFPLADFVVNPSGPVQGNVFATVQAALDQVTIDYQIVQIKSGVFQGVANTNLVFPSEHPILLMSESGARGTILDGGGTARGLTLSTSSVVDGITIRNAAAVHGAAVYISGGSPLLINNVFFNNQAQQSGGAVYQEAGNSLLVHTTLRNNLAGTGGSGIAVASGSFRAEKSILWDGGATSEIAVSAGAFFEATESIVKGGYPGNGNSSGDPLLQDDGHLMGSSPAVDSGGILQTALRDMDGETRPSGTTTDIGADEWVDSDGDQLPDWWEWLQFGGLETLASVDPDGDGLTNLQEYQQGSDPHNYYSQGSSTITPVISIVSGNNQQAISAARLEQPFVVQVTNNGNPLVNAPVAFSVTTGGLDGGQGGGNPVGLLSVVTDANGQASAFYTLPSGGGTYEATVQTGSSNTSFTVEALALPAAPVFSMLAGTYTTQRNVVVTTTTSGCRIHYTLDGTDPSAASASVESEDTILVDHSATLKARAIATNGGQMSTVMSAEYKITGMVAAGSGITVSLKRDGTVWAWGTSWDGQLGGSLTTTYVPAQVNGLSGIASVTVGAGHTVALKSDGTVWALGRNSEGQLGDGTTTRRIVPVQVSGLSGAVSVAAGYLHTVALKDDGTVWAWGDNEYGQLGDGTTSQRNSPVQVSGLSEVVAISAGNQFTVALKRDGTVWTWGSNGRGKLGDGTTTNRMTPVQVVGINGVVAVAAGYHHVLALKSDGTVWGWGYNGFGQLADGTTTDRKTPVQVSGLSGVLELVAGDRHTVARKGDGTVWAWGDNSEGQLGDGTRTNRSVPLQADGVSDVISVATGGKHTVVLKSDGTICAWGRNLEGQLGDGTISGKPAPLEVSRLSGVVGVDAAAYHSIATKSDGTVWTWGQNWYGELGDGTTTYRNTPVLVSGMSGVVSAKAGYYHTVALKSDGTVWTWGLNSEGQLGDGSTTQRIVPVQVNGLTGVIAVSAGLYHSVALKNDGTIWAWGRNVEGQLGDGTTTRRTVPVQIGSMAGVVSVMAGAYHTVALKDDGTVWTWGLNSNGQLGDGTTVQKSLPVQVSGMSGVMAVATRWYHTVVLRTDGTVWAWGYNRDGQLGDGTSTQRNLPVQVRQLNEVVAIAAGQNSMVVKSDGTVWTWFGTWLPSQVSGLTGVVALSVGSSHTLAVKSDGTVWAWGGNWNVQMGVWMPSQTQTLMRLTPDSNDANQNAIPDAWEIQQFGNTTTSMGNNSDGDGLPHGQEYFLGTNPQSANTDSDIFTDISDPEPLVADAYQPPEVTLVGGDHQKGLPGDFLGQPVEVLLTLNGQPMPNAPVIVRLTSGDGKFAPSLNFPILSDKALLLHTDAEGRARAFLQLPNVEGPIVGAFGIIPFAATATYDTDGNTLPDAWEVQHFGGIGQDPAADPDGDGLSNLQEYQTDSDPKDYYSQAGGMITPTISIVSGNNQMGVAGSYASAPLVVEVVNASNPAQVLPNAPVQFMVTMGTGLLDGDSVLPASGNLMYMNASAQGLAQINYFFPTGTDEVAQITAQTAGQSVAFSLSSLASVPPSPESLQVNVLNSSQMALGWSDTAVNETVYKVERSLDGVHFTEIASNLPQNTTAYTDAGLKADTEYFYRIRCANAAGNSSYSNVVSATTQAMVDVDNDGMDDSWELTNGVNPLVDDSQDDEDGDRIPNIFEYQHGTLANDVFSKPTATFVVDPSTADNSLTDNIYATIQEAVDRVHGYWDDDSQSWRDRQPYAVIEVKAGVYEEQIYIRYDPVLLLGELGATQHHVEIRGNAKNDDYTLRVTSSSVLDGFVISLKDGCVGAGVYVYYDIYATGESAKRRMVNCLIRDNHTGSSGGGLYNDSADLSLVHCTIFGNTASYDANGIYNSNGTVSLTNSIVWDPVGDPNLANAEIAGYGTNFVTVHSIVGGGEQGGIDVDPQLTPTGGLKSGSLAINPSGVPLAKVSLVDIHGERRDQTGAPDLGADEYRDDNGMADGDGLPDWAEGLDDEDGLSATDEYQLYGTDPHAADTDGDGLSDGQEVALSVDPRSFDTDLDGMDDGYEVVNGLAPLVDDSQEDPDGDRVPNVFEYAHGTLVNDAASKPTATCVVDQALGDNSIYDHIYSSIQEALNVQHGYWDNSIQGWVEGQPYGIIEVRSGYYEGRLTLWGDPVLLLGQVTEPSGPPVVSDLYDDRNYDLVLVTSNSILDGFEIVRKMGEGGYGVDVYSNDYESTRYKARLVNCIIRGNPDGGVYIYRSKLDLLHCTITGNTANWGAAGIYNDQAGSLRVINSIVWGNISADSEAPEIESWEPANPPEITNSIVSGGIPGGFDEDPLLTPVGRLTENSYAAINRVASGSPWGQATRKDIDGELRPEASPPDDCPDLGADEFKDSDGNGLPDRFEGIDDGDTLDALVEYENYGTDPLLSDSDGDGRSDGEEISGGTNPLNPDTDGDGMEDGWEIANNLAPLIPDAMDDPDGDRVPNIFEYAQGRTNPQDETAKPLPDFVVDPATGNADWDDNVLATISEAINAAGSGYWDESRGVWVKNEPYPIIEVKYGTYPEQVAIWSPVLLLGELGAPQGPPVILGADFSYSVTVSSDSVLDGFVITHDQYELGGGVEARSFLRLVNCIIRDNWWFYNGAGMKIGFRVKVDLLHCTIVGNETNSRGNAVYNDGALNLVNCIVWGNGGATAQQIYSRSGSSVQGAETCIIKNGEYSGINENPLLTTEGYLASPSSPAINRQGITLAGASLVDIHGERRDENSTPDLGADEFRDANGVDDGDGVPDVKEFDDGDGLSEGAEVLLYGTDPYLWDTDGDGLGDGWEISNTTNPLDTDTDDDGMLDGEEIANGLNPLADDTLEDLDGDRVPNIYEIKRGTFANNESSRPQPTFVVDPGADNNNTEYHLCATIQEAINKAEEQEEAYAIIDVKPGIYNESVALLDSISSVAVLVLGNMGSTVGLVHIQASDGVAIGLYGNHSVLDGLIISHAPGKWGLGVFSSSHDSHVRLVNCIIRDNKEEFSGGGIYNAGSELDLVHCTIVGNQANLHGNAIYNDGILNLTNCIVWGNNGMATEQIFCGVGSTINGAETCIIENGEHSGINEDPQLTGRGWLESTSPAINRPGISLALASKVDILGERRDGDAVPDLGADEYHDDNGVNDWDGVPDMDEIDDGDGLSSMEEIDVLGTNPFLSDTDGDDVADDLEVNTYHSNPLQTDSDGDGLDDGLEVQIGTNPIHEDTDRDGMRDDWEYQWRDYPIHPDPLLSDALNDIDGDFLNNLKESQLGMNPCVAGIYLSQRDTDQDGLTDTEETKEFFTDPLVNNGFLFSTESIINGNQGTFTAGAIEKESSIYFYGNSEAVYNFNVSSANVYVATVLWQTAFDNGRKNTFHVHFWCDGVDLGYRSLVSNGLASETIHNLRLVLPYLRGGSHQLKMEIFGTAVIPCLQIDRIEFSKIVDDASQPISNIAQGRLNALNGLLTSATTSPTSPLCLEGRGRFVETIRVNESIIPRPALKDRWYADVPLQVSGATPVSVAFENGAVTENLQVEWVATNLFSCADTLTVRKGDSLKFIGVPQGAAPGETSSIQVGSETFFSIPEVPVAYSFKTAGAVSVVAKYGVQMRRITVQVVEADFGTKTFAVIGSIRKWNCSKVPCALPSEADAEIQAEKFSLENGGTSFCINLVSDESIFRIVARAFPGGAIVAVGEVQGLHYYSWSECGLQKVGETTDGRDILEMTVRLSTPWEEGLSLRLNTWKTGSTFDDGSIIRTWTASDVAEDGSVTIRFYHPKNIGGPCHSFGLYQGDTPLN